MPRSWDRPGQSDAAEQPSAQEASSRLSPDAPRDADRADRLATADQPERWSRADLQQRLERLPPGHPSSPPRDGPGEPDLREAVQDREADAVKRDFWSELPAFERAWADHVRRWPKDEIAAAVDRSRDPAGSWRGDGNQYLDPEQHTQAKDVIATVQRREESITERLTEVDRDTSCGGWLVGLEHRLKGEDRIKEKIADLFGAGAPDATYQEVLRALPDAIRYTFRAETADYTEAYSDIKGRLEARGFEMEYNQNHWTGTQYKGINTRWVTSDGQQFEVQFHTRESFHAKHEVTHPAYERLRSPLTQDAEREELMAFQEEVCSWIPAPEGATDIPNHRKEVH